jgi:hypothetical protein
VLCPLGGLAMSITLGMFSQEAAEPLVSYLLLAGGLLGSLAWGLGLAALAERNRERTLRANYPPPPAVVTKPANRPSPPDCPVWQPSRFADRLLLEHLDRPERLH